MNIPERPKSQLTFGAIPAHTTCPFLKECSKGTMKCFVGHQGTEHSVDFSCAIARGFDILKEQFDKRDKQYEV